MITLRKALSPILAASLLMSSMLLTGCHGNIERDEFVVPEQFDTTRQFEITFWAKNDTNVNQTRIYNQAIEDFETLYPNIHVTIRPYTDYNKIYNDVITNIATDTTPNVCITYPDHIATYISGENTVVPLDNLFVDERYGLGGSEVRFESPTVDQIVPQFLDECMINGVHYCMPYMRSTEALYINKTYVEALGYEIPDIPTWDWVWEVSNAATARNEDGTYAVNGQEVMIPFIYKSSDNMMITMLRQLGAGYSDDYGNIGIFNDTTTSILRTVADEVAQGAFSTFNVSGYPGNFLNAGQCIFGIDSTAGSTWMGSDAPLIDIHEENVVDFEMVVRPVPQFDPENPLMISQGPSVCVFNKEDPQEVLAAWLFAQYLISNDVQIAYSETEGYVPVTLKAQQDPVYQDYLARSGEDNKEHYRIKIEAAELLMANTANTFTTPVFQGSTSVRDAAGLLIENVTKAERRKQPVDEKSLDQLRTDACSLYQLNPSAPGWTAQADASAELTSSSGAGDQGPLPTASRVLLGTLAAVWVLIGLVYGYSALKRRRERHKKFT